MTILADGFPDKVVYGYFPGWGTQTLSAVSQNFNVLSLFSARTPNPGPNSGDGSVTWQFGNYPTLADVQAVRARGQKVILAIGGAGFGYIYDTRAKTTALRDSLYTIINAFGGLDGVDFNFFEGGILTSGNRAAVATELIWLVGQLRGTYGATFGIISPPNGNSPDDQYLMQQLANAGCLTWCNPQFYDWSGFKTVGYISGLSGGEYRIKPMIDLVGPTKCAIGLSSNYSYTTSLTLAEANREVDEVLRNYPTMRGVSCWETTLDGQVNWQFANNFASKFASGPAPAPSPVPPSPNTGFVCINDRDLLLQQAAERVLPDVEPPANIVPGYTGVTLVKDIGLFVGAYSPGSTNWISPDRAVLTAQLKGIPFSAPVAWETGLVTFTSSNPMDPGVFTAQPTSIILTDTADPLVKTIEASSYSKASNPTRVYPSGWVRVKVNYGGEVFYSPPLQIVTYI